jgi:hypothetical protein
MMPNLNGCIPNHGYPLRPFGPVRAAIIYCEACSADRLHFRTRWPYFMFVLVNTLLILITFGLWLLVLCAWLLLTANEKYYCGVCGAAHRRFRSVGGFSPVRKLFLLLFFLLIACVLGNLARGQ